MSQAHDGFEQFGSHRRAPVSERFNQSVVCMPLAKLGISDIKSESWRVARVPEGSVQFPRKGPGVAYLTQGKGAQVQTIEWRRRWPRPLPTSATSSTSSPSCHCSLSTLSWVRGYSRQPSWGCCSSLVVSWCAGWAYRRAPSSTRVVNILEVLRGEQG